MNPVVADSRPRRGRLVRWAGLIAVMLVSICLATLLAEVAVRVIAPQQLIQMRPDLWQPDDTLGWILRPNVEGRINTGERAVHLFTDRDAYRVGANGRREAPTQVLLIGDSFMEAVQVEYEQTTAHVLETMLSERLGRPVAVRDAGVAGWDPNQYLLRTRQLVSRDSFALVVVAVFVGNDAVPFRLDRIPPRAPETRHAFRFPRGLSRNELVTAVLAPLNDVLEVRSHLYILAKNQLSTLRMRLGLTADYMPREYRRDEAASPRWRNTAELSRDLARAAAARGIPAVFVLVPERFQVYSDEFRRYLRGFKIDSGVVDLDQPSRRLFSEFAAQKLRVVDALPGMRAVAETSHARLYGTVDQHLSPSGHRALAELVLPEALRALRRQ